MPSFEVQMRWRNRLCTVPIGRYNKNKEEDASTFIDALESALVAIESADE